MQDEWNEVKLGDNCKIKGGKRLPKGERLTTIPNNHPYIKVKDMGKGKTINLNETFEYVGESAYNSISNYIVNNDDIIISIVGTVGLVSIIGKSLDGANLTENCVKLTDIKDLNKDFIYYYLTSIYGQNEIEKGIVGSTQPKLPIYNIKKISIIKPPLKEQKAIANILSSLDDKIELNNQINKTLEQMAQTIFKHWFVDFEFPNEDGESYKSSGGEMVESELGMIPKGWEVKVLKDIASMKNGVNYSREQEGEKIKVVNVRDFDGSLIIDKFKLDYIHLPLKQIEDYRLEKYDCVVVRSAKPGETLLAIDNSKIVYSGFTIRVRTHDEFYKLFMFYCVRNSIQTLNNSSNGTVFKNLNQQILGSLKIVIPETPVLNTYNAIAESLLNLMIKNTEETTKLSNLRDTLLPKLMSGEIRVPLKEGDMS